MFYVATIDCRISCVYLLHTFVCISYIHLCLYLTHVCVYILHRFASIFPIHMSCNCFLQYIHLDRLAQHFVHTVINEIFDLIRQYVSSDACDENDEDDEHKKEDVIMRIQ